MNTSSYPLLFKHGIISNSNDDPGSIITFLIDRMAMADENADNREGQTWHVIQSNDDLKAPFNNFNIINEIMRIGGIMGSTVSSSEVGVMIIESLLYVKQNFSSEQTNAGTRMLMMMAIADQALDDRELNLFFDYGKWAQKDSDRIKSLETLSKVCKDANISYSKEKIQFLINKVNDTDSEPKKEINEPKYKLGAIEIYEDDGSVKVLDQYLKSVDRMIQSLNDQPIEFLQNNTKYLKKVREEATENRNCIDGDDFIFFAFSSTAEECAELMRIKSGESQFEARFYFHDLSSNKFCFQSVDNGEWESGWITDSPKDEFFSSDLMGFKVPEKIKDNLKILEKNGSEDLHENLHSKLKNSINEDSNMSNYPLLRKHNIIGSKNNPDVPSKGQSLSSDAACIVTFLADRIIIMTDEKERDKVWKMWNGILEEDQVQEELLTDNYEANSEYVRIRKILIAMNKQINNVSATNRMVDDMVNEAINFLEKEFNPEGQNIVINILMDLAKADGDLDDGELELIFKCLGIIPKPSIRLEFLNFLAKNCEEDGINYSKEKITSLINKVNNPTEQKKETEVKQMIALPDGTVADLMDTSHWNMGAFELHYEYGEEEGLKDYLETLRKMINILSDQPIVFLQNNDLFLEKVIKESKKEEYFIEVYLWFAFPGKAEKCAEMMRKVSGDGQYFGTIHFYDMFEKRFWYQSVDSGEWDTGWVESGKDNVYFSTYLENEGIPGNINENYKYLKSNGLDRFKKYIDSSIAFGESISENDEISNVKILSIKCDGNFSRGNLLGLSVYSYDSSDHNTIMNTLENTTDINAEVMDSLPIKLIKDYYGFRDPSLVSINLDNNPLSFNIKNNEVDFTKDLKNDSLLIQEFPISGLISIEVEHSKNIIFNQIQIKHFPNNSLITSVLVNDEEYDFNDYTDPHTYFPDQFFTKTFSKKDDKQSSKKQLESKNPKEKNVPAWKKIKTAMESFGPLYAAEYGEIMDYCNKHFGEVKKSTFRTYIISCTVNHNSRIHYSPNKKERKDLLDNDVLYQVEEGMVTLYNPKKHGHWYIKKGSDGKLQIEKF